MEQARTTGRALKPVEFEILGELTEVDLSLLDEEKGSKAPAIKRLSERHHALARNIADGRKMGEAALICGYDPSRVSILNDDPAFQELVKFYASEIDRVRQGVHETIAMAEQTAWDLVIDKMDDNPDKVKITEALEIAKAASDRLGRGPSSTQKVDVNINLGSRLEAARKRIAERNRMIDVTPQQAAE